MSTFKGYTIYNKPRDFPNKFVVRGWSIQAGTVIHDKEVTAITDTLIEARAAVPMRQDFRIVRDFVDDPVIVESWV